MRLQIGRLVRRTAALAIVAGLALGGAAASAGRDPSAAAGRLTAPRSPYLSRVGSRLFLEGRPYRSVGLDAYELATDWGVNQGCGGTADDGTLESLFAGLPTDVTLRIWGFQGSMATNPATRARDWSGLDRVVAAASRHGVHLIVSLANQDGSCDDGHWKDPAWYLGGYRALYPGDGYTIATVSYWVWVHQIVGRYRNSPTIAMWELVNEPEASTCAAGYSGGRCYEHLSCPDQAGAVAALRSFADSVGTEIKRLDPNHLIESGTLGGGQCGLAGPGYETVVRSPGVDVASFHDYDIVHHVPADLVTRVVQSATARKPLIIGELGEKAAPGVVGCPSLTDRVAQLQSKLRTERAAGASLILLWDWVPPPRTSACTFDITAGDPALALLGPF
jgi:mannan endo-1,4-beta-mannosidase